MKGANYVSAGGGEGLVGGQGHQSGIETKEQKCAQEQGKCRDFILSANVDPRLYIFM